MFKFINNDEFKDMIVEEFHHEVNNEYKNAVLTSLETIYKNFIWIDFKETPQNLGFDDDLTFKDFELWGNQHLHSNFTIWNYYDTRVTFGFQTEIDAYLFLLSWIPEKLTY